MPFYAVARGRTIGMFSTWDECKTQVDKFPNARYKKFNDKASAEAFILEHKDPSGTATAKRTAKPSSSEYSILPPKGKSAATLCSVDAVPKISNKLPASIQSRSSNKLAGRSQVQLIPARPMSTTGVNAKRKLKVTEDRVVGIKKAKLDSGPIEFNNDVDLSQFSLDEDGYVVVFTDGACKGNGRILAKAGIGVWFGDDHPMNISLPVEGNRRTNNTAEIQAAEKAIIKAKEAGINKLNVKTDSQFLINCITKWIYSWRKNNWKRSEGGDVKNRQDLEKLSAATECVQIKWSYVPGHKGVYGNEKADQLAVAGSQMSIPRT